MKKRLYLSLIIALALLLCACKAEKTEVGNTIDPTKTEPVTDPPVTTAPPIENTEPETTVPPEPQHSELYLPQYTTQQIWEYFEEIVFRMEYSTGTGDISLVQKWETPLRYCIFGDPTEEDLAVLNELFAQLNTIRGFPGIYPAPEGDVGNLTISFTGRETFSANYAEILNGEDANGATQFWYYTDTNEIHTATIGYRTDLDQSMRNSILLEEVINMLGASDTVLREDSIVYQYSDENTALSDVDWVIMKILYNPAIQCGMDAEDCYAVVESLYY